MEGISETAANALKKAKTHKGRKVLQAREAQVHEPAKRTVFMKGNKTSTHVLQLLTDLYQVKKPEAVYLSSRRQTDLHPFEDIASAEYLCKKNEAPIFCLGSCSKKRPFRLVIGRTFDETLLDMVEFSVTNYKPMAQFPGVVPPQLGSKPLVLFQGAAFEGGSTVMRTAQSILADFFRGPKPAKVCLKGIDHCVIVSVGDSPAAASSSTDTETAVSPADLAKLPIQVRYYRTHFKKSGTKLPRVELEEMGPSFDLTVDRYRLPEAARWKASIQVPKEAKQKREKNITTNVLGEKRGRVHLGAQEFDKIHTPHFHGKPGEGPKSKKVKKQMQAERDAVMTDE